MKYLKSSIEVFKVWFHFTTFPVGWVVGWVSGWVGGCVIRKYLSLKVEVEVEAELGKNKFRDITGLTARRNITPAGV